MSILTDRVPLTKPKPSPSKRKKPFHKNPKIIQTTAGSLMNSFDLAHNSLGILIQSHSKYCNPLILFGENRGTMVSSNMSTLNVRGNSLKHPSNISGPETIESLNLRESRASDC